MEKILLVEDNEHIMDINARYLTNMGYSVEKAYSVKEAESLLRERLTHGADCSGFVRGVYREFGISLPRCSYEQCYSGIRIPVDEAKPGDLLFYANGRGVYHVMICYSNDGEGHIEVVHARDEKRGIVVSGLNYAIACWATTYEYFYEKEEPEIQIMVHPEGWMTMKKVKMAEPAK